MEKALTSAITWEFLDDLHDGIIIADLDGTVLYSNQAVVSHFGLNHSVRYLDDLNRVLAASEIWQDLLEPPAEAQWLLTNGRLLNFDSQRSGFQGENLLKVVIHPATTPSPFPLADFTSPTQPAQETEIEQQLQELAERLTEEQWQRVIITLRDENFQPTNLIVAGFSQKEKQKLHRDLIGDDAWLALFNIKALQKFRHDNTYFVPSDSDWAQTFRQSSSSKPSTANKWQPLDTVAVPLYDRQQTRIGLIRVDKPVDGRRPDAESLKTLGLYAQFAAALLENAHLVQAALERSREFELLLSAGNAFSTSLETDTVLSLLGQQVLQATEALGYTIFRWHSGEEKLVVLQDFPAGSGRKTKQKPGVSIPITDLELLRPVLFEKTPILQEVALDHDYPIPKPIWLNDREPYHNVILPLVLADETFAIFYLVNPAGKEINERELRLLTALANQAGAALETALIFEDTYERERFYGAMGNVSLALNYTLDNESVISLICRESLRIFKVDGAYVWQIEDGALVSSAAGGPKEADFAGGRVPLTDENNLLSHIANSGSATFINHLPDEDFSIYLPNATHIQAVLGVPLEAEGNLIGVLILTDTTDPNRFTDKDVTQATTFGVQIAIALQNSKLFNELRQLNEELDSRVAQRTMALHEESNRVKILLRITTELSASLDQDRVLTQALDLVNEVVNATDGVILLLNQETGEFDFRASLSQKRPLSHRGIPSGLKQDEGLAGWMLENRSAVIVHNTKSDPRWMELPSSSSYRSVLGVPLISNEEVIGVLMLFHDEKNAFTNQQLDLVEAAAIQVANAINNASLYNLIFDQAEQLGTMLRGEIIQKANLQSILESIADGVIVAGSQNEIEITNISASNILDIPRERLIGKPINELLGVYGRFGDTWMATINHWADNSDQLEPGTFLDDRLTIEEKHVSLHLSPVLSDGNFFGTVSIFRDITKEVEVDRLKSEFVSTVSHELRTPMTSIKGYADLMLMGASGQLTEHQERYLQVIKSNADRLHDLVDDLLNISSIETGKTTLVLRPLDVHNIVEQIEGHLNGRIQHEGKDLNIEIDIMEDLPLVNADFTRVTQILTNLVDNAFNYTPTAGRIIIHVEARANFVYISVHDTGIGITSENIDKIFDRFFRAEDAAVQQVSGTGLGLAIVRSLIEMHGGHLDVESEKGKGSTFTFSLPVVIEDSDPT